MYFDTLKVSTVEQTAEQTSARGGPGNPELIIWDYGKEITVTLEDALFTPASQSLMWGGKFGTKHSKIYGIWNPIDFPLDSYGRKIYLEKRIATLITTDGVDVYKITNTDGEERGFLEGPLDDSWISFVSPCDEIEKWYKYAPLEAPYKYLNWKYYDTPTEDQLTPISIKCPKGYPIYHKKSDSEEIPFTGYEIDEVRNLGMWKNKKRPEIAEIIAENFGDFNLEYYAYQGKIINDIENICLSVKTDEKPGVDHCSGATGYIWNHVDLKMNSLEGDQDLHYLENSNIRFTIPQGSSNKNISVAIPKLYKTKYDDKIGEWVKESDEEVGNYVTIKSENKSSYGYYIDEYESKIDFYIEIKEEESSPENDFSTYYIRVKVGTFYIIRDWNLGNVPPQDWIYPIEDGMNDVYYLDRFEKCKARQTFAINADSNLLLANRKLAHKYDHCEMTIFIDPKTMKPYEGNATTFMRKNGTVVTGNLRIIKQHEVYYRWTRRKASDFTTLGHEIVVDATHYPGTYRLVGETYARSRATGKDERYQFEIPLCKMSDNTNLTLQADGDPTTFSMELKCLRRDDGTMMKLTQYLVECNESGSFEVVEQDGKYPDPTIDEYYEPYETDEFKYFIVSPKNGTVYYIDTVHGDEDVPSQQYYDSDTGISYFPALTNENNEKVKGIFTIGGETDLEILEQLQYKLKHDWEDVSDQYLVIAAVHKDRNYSDGTATNKCLWIIPNDIEKIEFPQDGEDEGNITISMKESQILQRYYEALAEQTNGGEG